MVDAEHSDVDVFNLAGTYQFSFGSEGNGPGPVPRRRSPAGDRRRGERLGRRLRWLRDREVRPGTARRCCGRRSRPRSPWPASSASRVTWRLTTRLATSGWPMRWNQRFQRFSSTGVSLGAWGQRGPGGAFDMNYPRSIAINPANRQIWVANERGHHIQVYNYPTSQTAAPTYVGQIGQIGSDDIDPNHFRWPVDIEFYQPPTGNMRAIIGDRMASSVKIFDAVTRQEITRAVDPDPTTAENPMITARTTARRSTRRRATSTSSTRATTGSRSGPSRGAGSWTRTASRRSGSAPAAPSRASSATRWTPLSARVSCTSRTRACPRVQAFNISGTPLSRDRSHDRLRHPGGQVGCDVR